ncbi:outer membrane lipoprotein-sorting protein [Agaribacterium sp. ZY112]|uniref:outer membrane lipoprotein-sorting protein n=1 Tax=Agaribacterium sp. ZY112 TaxID=3233574 RepID=UPI003524A6B4
MKAYLLTSLFLLCSHSAISGELPSGDQIAKNINARNEGESVSRLLTMSMTDKRGKTRTRETRAFRQYSGEDKHTAIFYLSPSNIKGTAFLTYDYNDLNKDDDQWLYLPAARRVRRISASDRGDYFLGTDFTYEEIKLETRVSMLDYDRQSLRIDTINGTECVVVESTVKNKKIAKELGISRREDCVDHKIWMVIKSTQWGINGHLLKTIYFKEIYKVDDIWTAHKIEVENHKTKHQTVFTFSDVNYSAPLDKNLFTQTSLRRGI